MRRFADAVVSVIVRNTKVMPIVVNRIQFVQARCNGDSLRAGKSSWQLDYRVSDLQQDSKVVPF